MAEKNRTRQEIMEAVKVALVDALTLDMAERPIEELKHLYEEISTGRANLRFVCNFHSPIFLECYLVRPDGTSPTPLASFRLSDPDKFWGLSRPSAVN